MSPHQTICHHTAYEYQLVIGMNFQNAWALMRSRIRWSNHLSHRQDFEFCWNLDFLAIYTRTLVDAPLATGGGGR